MPRRQRQIRVPRRGIVLIIVFVVVLLLALEAGSYLNQMTIALASTNQFARQLEARTAAESGMDWQTMRLARARGRDEWHLLASSAAQPQEAAAGSDLPLPRFQILGTDPDGVPVNHPVDESSRIDLHRLRLWYDDPELQAAQAFDRNPLTNIPGVTAELADAIFDWIDRDQNARRHGAEAADYQAMGRAGPPNRAIRSLADLIHVRGMTEALLFGEDSNRNGLLDLNEDDGDARLPADNRNGRLDAGISQFVTLASRQDNRNRRLQPRYLLNTDAIEQLYRVLISHAGFSRDEARFIAAWRYNGRTGTPRSAYGSDLPLARGLDGLSQESPPVYRINSLTDLIDAEVTARRHFSGQEVLISPFQSYGSEAALDRLLDTCSTVNKVTVYGRVNVNKASETVLRMLPFVTPQLAARIVERRAELPPDHDGVAWLVARNVMPLASFSRIEPYITGRGHQFRFVSVGQDSLGRLHEAVSVVADVREALPRVRTVSPVRVRLRRNMGIPMSQARNSHPGEQ